MSFFEINWIERFLNRITNINNFDWWHVTSDNVTVLGPDGKERATTKLIIDGVPLQEGEESIKKRLEELGAIFCAKDPIKLENHYDIESKRFSELLTGRRYAYIVLPIKELPKAIRVGPYIARLYYKEMVKELPACRNCNEKGHWANQCPHPKKCYDCKQPGHKKVTRHVLWSKLFLGHLI